MIKLLVLINISKETEVIITEEKKKNEERKYESQVEDHRIHFRHLKSLFIYWLVMNLFCFLCHIKTKQREYDVLLPRKICRKTLFWATRGD